MRLYPLLTLHLSSSHILMSMFLTDCEPFHEPENLFGHVISFIERCRETATLAKTLTKTLNSYNVPVFSKNGERPTYYPGYHQTDITRIKA